MKIKSSQLSEETHRKLSSAQGRRASVQIWNLILALLAGLLILASLAMLIDWVFACRSSILRVVMSLSVCVGFLLLARWVWRQLPFDRGLHGTAKWLDAANPALQERLVTVIELSEKGSHSPELLEAVSKQVDAIGVRDHPRRVISAKPFLSALVAFVCAFVMLGFVKMITGSGFGGLLNRLVVPWSDRTVTNLSQDTTSSYHPRGQSFDVAASITGKIPSSAILEYRTAGGSLEQREITIDRTSGTLQTTIPRMEKDFTYRLVAGDDETSWQEITVIDRPQLKDVKLIITPPSYTKLDERVWTTLPRRVEVPEGSHVSLSFTADQKLPATKIIQRGDQKELTTDLFPNEQGRFQFDSNLADSMQAEIQLTSVVGALQSRFPITLAVKLDAEPEVKLLDSTETFAMTADETLDVAFQAVDDYGIKSAELVAELTKPDGTKKEFRFPLDLQGKAGEKDLRITASLDLKQIPLEKGDDLQFAVEVRDEHKLQASDPATPPPNNQLFAKNDAHPPQDQVAPQEPTEPLPAEENPDGKPPGPDKNSTSEPAKRSLAKQGLDQKKKADSAKSGSKQSESPEAKDIEKRKLDIVKAERPPAKSASAKVTVDELTKYRIGGDGMKKQQIAIQEVLDLILESALDARTRIAQTGTPPKPEDEITLAARYATLVATKAPEIQAILQVGADNAEELRKRSEGTPYAFFGLQAKALVETGFAPAFKAISQGVKSTAIQEKAKQLQLADERLRWIVIQLEKNKKQFEEMIAYEEVIELAHKFKKMHEITMEDMPSSDSECCRAGPYAKLKDELTDAQVQKAIAGLKLKREILKRLSELLQKNPELRARHLAQSGESGKIYREELSRLRNRQAEIVAAVSDLTKQPSDKVSRRFEDMLRQRLLKFSSNTTEVLGLARIWIPTDTPAPLREELEAALGQLSQGVEQLAKANPRVENEIAQTVDAVKKFRIAAGEILAKPQWKENYGDYSSFRTEDLAGMSSELDACVQLTKALQDRADHLFLSQIQNELNVETRTITLGMMDQLGTISGVSPIADKMIEELDKLLSGRLYPMQQQAFDSLSVRKIEHTLTTTVAAVTALEKATRLLDSSITEFVRAKSEHDALAEINKLPSGEAKPLPDPTKDEIEDGLAKLLRRLEEESRKSSITKLGIGEESNVKVKDDWEKAPKKKKESEKEALAQQRQAQLQAAKQAVTAAGKAQQIANGKAQQLAQQMGQDPTGAWKEQSIAQFNGRNDWNAIQSQLKESLTQDIDSTVPEEYRSAIEDYFRDISETNRQ